jgi:phospholipase A1/A2
MWHGNPGHLAKRGRSPFAQVRLAEAILAALAVALAPQAEAQTSDAPPTWQSCAEKKNDDVERLRCFDRWSAAQAQSRSAPAPAHIAAAATVAAEGPKGCDHHGAEGLTKFWDLTYVDDSRDNIRCGLFEIRGYRPLSLSGIAGDGINAQPTSDNPLNNATSAVPYRKAELRIQLSVRTKLWQGFLLRSGPTRDALWFGYTQQSYWQVFSGGISRPFRSTDHEPELIYVYPTMLELPGRWKLPYAGLGIVHQSNGQSLPLSRSWNRVYLMAGAERAPFTLQGRIWKRIPESAAGDDNPGISDYIGRAELTGAWDIDENDKLALTLRNSLRSFEKGSARIEWTREFGEKRSFGTLRFHVNLFNGYGDSLLDFNRRRTVLGIGVSLVER